jgi:hypothetical protein
VRDMSGGRGKLFSPGASCCPVGREAFVLNEASQRIYKLNAAATLVWSLCEENDGLGAVTPVIESALGITREEAEAYLGAILAQWAELGLTATSPSNGRVPGRCDPADRRRPGNSHKSANTDGSGRKRVDRCGHVLGKCMFRIVYASSEQEAWGTSVFGKPQGRQKDEIGSSKTNLITLEVLPEEGGGYSILKNNIFVHFSLAKEYVIPALKRSMMAEAVQASGCTFGVHAGVVHRGGQATILPAPSGSGKTTLVAGLIKAGFGYMSDEIALVDKYLKVQPLPVSLSIKQSAWELISELYPKLASATTHRRLQDDQLVRYLQPFCYSISQNDRSISLKNIVFPRHVPGGMAAISQLETHVGIETMLKESFLPLTLRKQTFARIIRRLQDCNYYVMQSPSLTKSMEMINSVT